MRRAKRMSIIFAAIAIVTTLLASSYPAQAQQQFEVGCGPSGPAGGGQTSCEGSDGPFEEDVFICVPSGASPGTPSVCTHELTGETFECEITDAFGFGRFTHRCGEAPAGGGDGGGGGGGGGTGDGGQQGGGGGVEITQEGEQESEAGEIDQSFEVS